jgi:hypothetical protein
LFLNYYWEDPVTPDREPTFRIRGLAEVYLDTSNNLSPTLEIVLDPNYRGDLNDIARKTAGPDDVYLRCNDASAINNPALAKFMEVLSHWDTTGDRRPDYGHVVDAIEDALWQSHDKPQEFHRPNSGWYTRLVMSVMPPPPEHHITFSFGELRPRFRWYHHAAALPMLAAVIALIQVQIHFVSWLAISPLTAGTAVAEMLGLPWWVGLVVVFVIVNIAIRRSKSRGNTLSMHTYGFFNKAALYEEQAFREGSENWTRWQRWRSHFAFGAIHQVNLFYPLATILPLALGGALFMSVYLHVYRKTHFRRAAVLEATLWHRVYNRMALTAFVVSLITLLGFEAVSLLAIVGLLVVLGTVIDHRRMRQQGTVPVPADTTPKAPITQ